MMDNLSSATSMQADAAMMAARRSIAAPTPTDNMERARKVAQDFEAVFLGQMLQPMFSEINAEEPFGGGGSEQMWRSMQVDEFGKAIAKSGGVGIGDALFREILKMQEAN